MLKKKTEKALKALGKAVKKAVHKGATEIGVDNAVDWSGRDGQEPSCSAHV
jgi:predicted secreted Zn-dependent protease